MGYGSKPINYIPNHTFNYLKNDNKGGKTIEAEPIPQLDGASLELFVEGTNGKPIQLYKCDSSDLDQCLAQ